MTNKSRPIKVIKADEPWNYIHLVDGTIIKTRHIVLAVLQILDDNGNPVIDNTGAAQYAVGHNSIQVVESSPMIEERQAEQKPQIKGMN